MNMQDMQNRPESEREAVKSNMKRATESAPAEFRDKANESKVVEIGDDLTNRPIQGIDPRVKSASQSGTSGGDDRQARIRAAAYAAWERRGRPAGHELEDWLEAERSLDPNANASPTE
ncbi:DUF2934 domain-containing protein [Variovorax sp. J31P179]|uniref:DUF2934 domain-containing protein n=1 Tax=Variovorax sp. J31P179 TaxID=3053508 RepID=UPI00257600BE|nr:DUF2934 domain-containing protein [Variovorax sp. J31P179]MDM0085553.1 DUF2934 domain-containing protein [Variovorax sp. J31P179]